MNGIKARVLIYFCMVCICGCNNDNKKSIQIVINGQGAIPAFIEGQWQDKESGWEFTFDKNGIIKEVVIPQGRVAVKPGITTKNPDEKRR